MVTGRWLRLNIGPGDEVISAVHVWSPTFTRLTASFALPVFADSDARELPDRCSTGRARVNADTRLDPAESHIGESQADSRRPDRRFAKKSGVTSSKMPARLTRRMARPAGRHFGIGGLLQCKAEQISNGRGRRGAGSSQHDEFRSADIAYNFHTRTPKAGAEPRPGRQFHACRVFRQL